MNVGGVSSKTTWGSIVTWSQGIGPFGGLTYLWFVPCTTPVERDATIGSINKFLKGWKHTKGEPLLFKKGDV